MTGRPKSPRLRVEQLEDRLTPAGSQIPAGEFNWTQYAPDGTLGQLIWSGQNLVYRTRVNGTWRAETVTTSKDFTRQSYDSVDQMQRAAQTAQLVYTANGVAHAVFLEKVYDWDTKKFQTLIRHYARTGGDWHLAETITPNWKSKWGPNNLVAEAGVGNSLHLIFTETTVAATGVGQFGTGVLWYATNKSGSWKFDRLADTTDLQYDVWFAGGRWSPRFLSLAVDAQNKAHVTYTPGFFISGAFGTVHSELRYATNATGDWRSEQVVGSLDGTGDAGLGSSVAVAPDGTVAVASYYVDRYETGSPKSSWLMYHTRTANGWVTTTVANTPDGYVAGDGAHFTGFAPQLAFDAQSRPTITFTDEAGEHLPVTYANEVAGQIRTATWNGSSWVLRTVFRQSNPLVNQLLFPVSATYNGQTMYAGVVALSTLDANRNPIRVDFTLTDVDAPGGGTVPPSPPPPAVTARPVLAAATEPGRTTIVRVTYSDGSVHGWTPFGSGFTGGAAVARGDVNRDGIADIIVASGAGIAGKVKVYDGVTRKLIDTHTPFGAFSGGLIVAAGDANGDGHADIAVGVAAGGPPTVALIDGATGQYHRVFQAYGASYLGGVRLAMGDVNKDGRADLVVAPGGGRLNIRVYGGADLVPGKGAPKLLGGLTAFSPQYKGPQNVAIGDLDGDGFGDVVVGMGTGAPRFQVFSGAAIEAGKNPAPAFTQLAWPPTGRGVRVAFAGDADGDGRPELVVAAVGADKVARYPTTRMTTTGWPAEPLDWFDPMPGVTSGVFVG